MYEVCSVNVCNRKRGQNYFEGNNNQVLVPLNFFKFPSITEDKHRFRIWVHACNRKDLKFTAYKNRYICSLHFADADIQGNRLLSPRLKKTANPTKFLDDMASFRKKHEHLLRLFDEKVCKGINHTGPTSIVTDQPAHLQTLTTTAVNFSTRSVHSKPMGENHSSVGLSESSTNVDFSWFQEPECLLSVEASDSTVAAITTYAHPRVVFNSVRELLKLGENASSSKHSSRVVLDVEDQIFNNINLPTPAWVKSRYGSKICCSKIEIVDDRPMITKSVTFSSDFSFQICLKSKLVSAYERLSICPFTKISTVDDCTKVLSYLENYDSLSSKSDLDFIIRQLSIMIEDLRLQISSDEEDNDFEAKLKPLIFVREQLKLIFLHTNFRRWSPLMIQLASLISSHSKAAYNALRSSGYVVLPCANTLSSYKPGTDSNTLTNVEHPYCTIDLGLRNERLRCDVCDKTFFSSATLRRHQLVHTNERRFKSEG